MITKTFTKPSIEAIKSKLNDLQYEVTQNKGTERPFQNDYWNHFQKGIYVDVVTGEPLFASTDKFDAHCGWPSFSKPIKKELVKYAEDTTFNMHRIEVKSQIGDSHLGHVFDDGPEALGGMRYCINSASLKFIPLEEMTKEGYEAYLYLFE